MLLFTSPVLDQKYHSGENFVQTLKFNCFKWNLVPRPIPPCKMQWRSTVFLFSTRNPLFGQICSKKPKLSVETEFLHLKLLEEPEFNSGVHFFCFWVEVRIFWANSARKLKIVSLKWSLVHGLGPIFRIQWWISLFCFWLKLPFSTKFDLKIQNLLFIVKFGS